MRISVPYGDGNLEAEIRGNHKVRIIDVAASPADKPVEELICQALDHPVGTPELEQMVKPQERIAIIMNDQTRPGPNREILAEIMKRLKRAGVPDDHVSVVIATGTHRAPNEEELKTIMGEAFYGKLTTHIHDCQDGAHVYLGETKSGMAVWIDRQVAEADFVIATGLIAPHHTAGFSGGRKSVVPGVAGMETLKIHHSLPIRPYEPSMGYAEGNPFHETALEAAKFVKVRFIVNVVQDAHRQNVDCVAGDMEKAHKKGMEICRKFNSVEVSEPADIVITSPGGSPRDCNLYQSQKAVSAAELFARKEGAIFILCARAEDGIGGKLLEEWLGEADNPQDVIDRFQKVGFQGGNNKAFMFARAMLKGQVIVVSDCLDPVKLKNMMLSWAPDLQTAVDRVVDESGNQSIIVLPRAVNLIPVFV